MSDVRDLNQDREGHGSLGPEVRSWWGRLLVGRRPLRTLLRSIVTVAIVFAAVKWCFVPIRVTGRSMEPTYRDGRVNLLNLLSYHRREPQRGDVVGIRLKDRRMILLKRILGMPGEGVFLRKGVVYINGEPVKEPYARGQALPSMTQEAELGANEYLVIGDNRDVSEYGIVERTEILGKVLF